MCLLLGKAQMLELDRAGLNAIRTLLKGFVSADQRLRPIQENVKWE
jgi:hypothetical protein